MQRAHVVLGEVAQGGMTIIAGGEAGIEGLDVAQEVRSTSVEHGASSEEAITGQHHSRTWEGRAHFFDSSRFSIGLRKKGFDESRATTVRIFSDTNCQHRANVGRGH